MKKKISDKVIYEVIAHFYCVYDNAMWRVFNHVRSQVKSQVVEQLYDQIMGQVELDIKK